MVHVDVGETNARATLTYWSTILSEAHAQNIMDLWSHIFCSLLRQPGLQLGAIDTLGEHGKRQITHWNSDVPPAATITAHHAIGQRTLQHPDGPAIHSWDGRLSYLELDIITTRLAHHLIDLGVAPEVMVPICFEKSMWAVVAMLGILKAGGALVPLDPAHPALRLKSIISSSRAPLVLTSEIQTETIRQLGLEITIINVSSSLSEHNNSNMDLEMLQHESLRIDIQPSSAAYIIYTSGSTGEPKGIVVEHAALCTSALEQARVMNRNEASRVLQYAAYTFDVSIGDIFTTLVAGGCVCIPSDLDRNDPNRLANFIRDAAIDHACLTASVANSLTPQDVPSLKVLTLGGEPMHQRNIGVWAESVRLLNIYGPAEATIWCTVKGSVARSDSKNNIGQGFAVATWIIDPLDHNRLVPIGAVGELLLEGPLLARGYLNDPARTAASFVTDPVWVYSFGPSAPGRRFYKTGDLARYNADGTIHFIGRKDAQVKLHGQRIELGEVEYHVRSNLPPSMDVAAEIVTTSERGSDAQNQRLVTFISLGPDFEGPEDLQSIEQNTCDHLQSLVSQFQTTAFATLPSYMLPFAYLPVKQLPLTTSGKIDHLTLQKLASTLSRHQLVRFSSFGRGAKQSPSTPEEHRICNLLAQVLSLEPTSIGIHDRFLQLGGDSIDAMHLVSVARSNRLSLSVAEVLSLTVAELALSTSQSQALARPNITPFSLLQTLDVEMEARRQALIQCGISEEGLVEDIYPCSPMQEGLMLLSIKQPGTYVSQGVINLPSSIDIAQFQGAWAAVYDSYAVLRTRIIEVEGAGLLQVVLRDSLHWDTANSLTQYLEMDRRRPMECGGNLSRYAIVQDGHSNAFVLTAHHSIYDGWSITSILDAVADVLKGNRLSPEVPFIYFIQHLHNTDSEAALTYWEKALAGTQAPIFPALSSKKHQPKANRTVGHWIPLKRGNRTSDKRPISSALIHAAWAFVIKCYTGSDDVVFGSTLAGRSLPIPGANQIVGPMITTVPIRVLFDQYLSVKQMVQSLIQQFEDMRFAEHVGLQQIRHISADARNACDFQSLLVVQSEPLSTDYENTIGLYEASGSLSDFNAYAMLLECNINAEGVNIHASFDDGIVDSQQTTRILNQFEHILREMNQAVKDDSGKPLSQIRVLNPSDLDEIIMWNKTAPPRCDVCVHQKIMQQAHEQPCQPAIHAWDGQLSYLALDELSSCLAHYLINLGVGPEVMVSICFEKSMWAVVSMLSILKAGGAFVPLDPRHPQTRMAAILGQVRGNIILKSTSLPRDLFPHDMSVISIDPALIERLSWNTSFPDVDVLARDAAYTIFTSGSTGEPKGIVVEHAALASSTAAQGPALAIGPSSRVFQFCSYAFDVSLAEIITTLVHGGCICIPSDGLDNTAHNMRLLQVNWAFFTPSVVRLLQPHEVPDLKTLVLGGEASTQDILDQWTGHLDVRQGYGPAECCIFCVSGPVIANHRNPGFIGQGIGARCWIASPEDYNTLVSIGTVGELLIEGPLLARQYLNDPARTAASFITSPNWAIPLDPPPARVYRTGDLVRYNSDGSITYTGRRDTQAKLHGQRIELGEIEYYLRSGLSLPPSTGLAVDLVAIRDNDSDNAPSSQILAAFIGLGNHFEGPEDLTQLQESNIERMRTLLSGIEQRLSTVLPPFMVPHVYLPLRRMPLSSSDKTDRKRLRELALGLDRSHLPRFSPSPLAKQPPLTVWEHRVRRLWAQVLSIDSDSIGRNDTFLGLGGDSLMTVKLVSLAHADNIPISIANVLREPKLTDLARIASNAELVENEEIARFSLLTNRVSINTACSEALSQCCLSDQSCIEDIYPCTPLQEGFMALSMKRTGSYLSQGVIDLPPSVCLQRFRDAWHQVIEAFPILRTRIIQVGPSLLQAVVKTRMIWETSDSLQEYLKSDKLVPIDFGKPLSRYAIVKDSVSGKQHFVWTTHHSIYDGWSLPMVVQAATETYLGNKPRTATPFNRFIAYLTRINNDTASTFWREKLAGVKLPAFPTLPHAGYQPRANDKVISRVLFSRNLESFITSGTCIECAWALVLSHYMDSGDVVFGKTVSGRNTPIANIVNIIGPTIATVPVRVSINSQWTIRQFLEFVQTQAIDSIAYEQTGLQNIRRVSADAHRACEFQTLLNLDLSSKENAETMLHGQNTGSTDQFAFNTFAVTTNCVVTPDELLVRVNFDNQTIEHGIMERLVSYFEYIVGQLSAHQDHERAICEVSGISPEHQVEIDCWNAAPSKPTDSFVHTLIETRAQKQPGAPAISSWDGEVSYQELDKMSTQLAHDLVTHDIGPGKFVAVCFEKTLWAVVAMLGVLKAGGTMVPVDPASSVDRLKSIAFQAEISLALTSEQHSTLWSSLVERTIAVNRSYMNQISQIESSCQSTVFPTTTACVIFTSTGSDNPTGIIYEHGMLAASALAQGKTLSLDFRSRVFQYSSFASDMMPTEILTSLVQGACICIPADSERTKNMIYAMLQLKVTWTICTSADLLQLLPEDLPSLETVVLNNEIASRAVVDTWAHEINLMQRFGPAECGGFFCPARVAEDGYFEYIDHDKDTNTWIVSSKDHNHLLPIGAVGELLIEGPLLAQGYLNDSQMTTESFIEAPIWAKHSGSRHPRRFFKTGDLVRYTASGSIKMVGHKDPQKRLHGQPIEHGELQHLLKRHIPAAIDVLTDLVPVPRRGQKPTVLSTGQLLTAFICLGTDYDGAEDSLEVSARTRERLGSMINGLENKLSAVLPAYMIPSAYIPLKQLPLSTTGEPNRQQLRDILMRMTESQLAAFCNIKKTVRPPSTPNERQLRELWAQVLSLDANSIGAEDSFLQLGGDSIDAMRLVSAGRAQSLSFTVADVLRESSLAELALVASIVDIPDDEPLPPFALLPDQDILSLARSNALTQCNIKDEDLEDIYPSTALQEALLSITVKQPGAYTSYGVIEIAPTVSLDAFCRAWEIVYDLFPILRSRLIQIEGGVSAMQVVVKDRIAWTEAASLKEYIRTDRAIPIEFGDRLSRYALIQDKQSGRRNFVWTMHHACYDGWSVPLILDAVTRAYLGQRMQNVIPFNRFIHYLATLDMETTRQFWREQLKGTSGPAFPALPSPEYQPRTNSTLDIRITIPRGNDPTAAELDVTTAVVLRAAWAMVIQCYTDSNYVVFGAALAGRNASLLGIDQMPGPTITTVPIRVTIDREQPIIQLLRNMQAQTIEMMPHEHLGLQEIRRLSSDARIACDFQSLLVVQPTLPSPASESILGSYRMLNELFDFNSYAVLLECNMNGDSIDVSVAFDDSIMDRQQIRRMLSQFEHVLMQIYKAASASGESSLAQRQPNHPDPTSGTRVQDINTISPVDKQEIEQWNSNAPVFVNECVHRLIEERVQSQPHAPAICAWDGEFCYQQLNEYSSQLAHQLIDLGVGPEIMIPLLFEKSRWMPVAMMGVMKAGGAFVPLDVSQPMDRMQNVCRQVQAPLVLCSSACEDNAKHLNKFILRVGESLFMQPAYTRKSPSTTVRPANAAYVIFTSGSTGQPKGCIIEHAAFCSSMRDHREKELIVQSSRVFQFSAFSFDSFLVEILYTLYAGACICIPSEADRKDNLAASIAGLNANWLGLTPSVFSMLSTFVPPCVKSVVLAGEPMRPEIVQEWAGKVILAQAYGPSECSVCSLAFSAMNSNSDPRDIGRGVGALTWVVQAENHNELVPIGAVGELLIEGPLLGRGYLNDPERTASSFISDLAWCHSEGLTKRRFYKTGDLVKYNADGSIMFVGRKDNQVKLRGQRIELGEVEYHLKRCLPSVPGTNIVVEVVQPAKPNTKSTTVAEGDALLAAFIALGDDLEGCEELPHLSEDTRRRFLSVVSGVEERLLTTLPQYMIPSTFIPVRQIPMTLSGKTDRKALRQLVAGFARRHLTALSAPPKVKRPPVTQMEREVQKLWGNILGLEPVSIGTDDHFLRLGGDSVLAMRLVAAARAKGITMSVKSVLQTPQLSDVARASSIIHSDAEQTLEPFSLLDNREVAASVVQQAALQCRVAGEDIEDAYPCTPLQAGLVALSMKHPHAYITQRSMTLGANVDIDAFRAAWAAATNVHPILRTRIIQTSDAGLVQVIIKGPVRWDTVPNGGNEKMALSCSVDVSSGEPLCCFALVRDASNAGRRFVWTIHHALYDGWSMSIILDTVARAYRGQTVLGSPGFNRFVQHQQRRDKAADAAFWCGYLDGASATAFPTSESPDYLSRPDDSVELDLPPLFDHHSEVTPSIFLHAAWAILLGILTNSRDVVYGTILTGRNSPLQGIDEIVGPTMTSVPIRVCLAQSETVQDLLDMVRSEAIRMIPHEQIGLSNIRRISPDARSSCAFQNLFIIQPDSSAPGTDDLFGRFDGSDSNGTFHTYPLIWQCHLLSASIRVNVNFDSSLLSRTQVHRLIAQFGHIISQLWKEGHSSPPVSLGKLHILSDAEQQEIEGWNFRTPKTVNACIHDLIRHASDKISEAIAVAAWDGQLTYRELEDLSSRLASRLHEFGVGQETLIPLCFSKSMWMTVAMLGVLKSGAAFVPLDPSHPSSRLQFIINQAKAKVILTSTDLFATCSSLSEASVLSLDLNLLDRVPPLPQDTLENIATPQNAAYVIFTSGSTGSPKGVVIEHAALCSSLHQQAAILGIQKYSRVFQYAAYTFDVSVSDHLTTLLVGGCICVPSEAARTNNLSQAMRELEVTHARLTPTVASLITPGNVPCLRSLALSGEPMSRQNIAHWADSLTLHNLYGPTECTIDCVAHPGVEPSTQPDNIGRAMGVLTWVVDSQDHNRLLPIGAIGELLIEGPLLGRGYLNDQAQTDAAFITDPRWAKVLSLNARRRFYKTGDLVKYNMDGTLGFVGRKDLQVKLHGLRIELQEAEYHIKQCLPTSQGNNVAVDFIEPNITSSDVDSEHHGPLLACFVSLGPSFVGSEDLLNASEQNKAALQFLTGEIQQRLASRLPSYMIPSVFLPLRSIPLSTSGKTDRKRLRQFVSGMTRHQLVSLTTTQNPHPPCPPATAMEMKMRRVWSQALGLDEASISTDDNFFRRGGDSILAIRLIAAARREEIVISFADIFAHQTLSRLAESAQESSQSSQSGSTKRQSCNLLTPITPFSTDTIAAHINRQPSDIEALFPAFGLQSYMAARGNSTEKGFTNYFFLDLGKTDPSRLETACKTIFSHHPILRTIFLQHKQECLQVVLRSPEFPFEHVITDERIQDITSSLLSEDRRQEASVVDLFVRFWLVQSGPHQRLIWRISHSQYDGLSFPLLLKDLEAAYCGSPLSVAPSFQEFVLAAKQKETAAKEHWRNVLASSSMPKFSGRCVSKWPYPGTDTIKRKVSLEWAGNDGITVATLVKAAWSIVLSHLSGKSKIAFGSLVSGRSMDFFGIEQVPGPCINMIPVCVDLGACGNILALFQQIQSQHVSAASLEVLTPEQLIAECAPWPSALRFSTTVQVQNLHQETDKFTFSGSHFRLSADLTPQNTADLALVVLPGAGELTVNVVYSVDIFTQSGVQELVDLFGSTIQALTVDSAGTLPANPFPQHPLLLFSHDIVFD